MTEASLFQYWIQFNDGETIKRLKKEEEKNPSPRRRWKQEHTTTTSITLALPPATTRTRSWLTCRIRPDKNSRTGPAVAVGIDLQIKLCSRGQSTVGRERRSRDSGEQNVIHFRIDDEHLVVVCVTSTSSSPARSDARFVDIGDHQVCGWQRSWQIWSEQKQNN